MSAALAQRQQALVDAVLGRAEIGHAGVLGLQGVQVGQGEGATALERGLRAYRLNAQALAANTLGGVFGRTQLALGDEASFAAMAWSFWRRCPPRRGDLGQWGEELADFLADQDGMPNWLCDLARLEWAVHCCERAADSELDAESLALLSEVEPRDLRLLLRPGIQLLQVEALAWEFWSNPQRGNADPGAVLGLVIARQAWQAKVECPQSGEWVLMSSLLGGADLEQALQQACAAQADFDFSAWLQAALLKGWLLGAQRLR
jgi:hypothetical protein